MKMMAKYWEPDNDLLYFSGTSYQGAVTTWCVTEADQALFFNCDKFWNQSNFFAPNYITNMIIHSPLYNM